MDDSTQTDRSLSRHRIACGLISLCLFAALGSWSFATKLAGAVVSSGQFVVDSHVKKVQHPVGGVVGDLLVEEGSAVKKGEVLLRLDATQARANHAIITKRLYEWQARKARLEAERDGSKEIAFPKASAALAMQASFRSAVESEEKLFESRRDLREGKRDQLVERIEQSRNEIAGYERQVAAYTRGLEILASEIGDLQGLYHKKLVSVQRLSALEREAATLEGERGEAMAASARAAGRIAEIKLQILQIDQDLKAEVGQELREAQMQIGELVERLEAARNELSQIDVRAPQDGIVHELTAHTVGGVVSPAADIMLIVPENDALAVDARVRVQDVDQLYVGQEVALRLSAFNRRTTPELVGHVLRVGADQSEDEKTGSAYYEVRVSVSPEELAKLDGLELVPGMPVEAFFKTEELPTIAYFLKPLTDQLERSFREE